MEASAAVTTLPARPEEVPAPSAPLREAVLAGAFFGTRNREAGGRLAAFVTGEESDGGALRAWFGPDAATRLAGEADALRGALDRDIAAIDALIGAQLDAILHHPRLRRLEGRWRGLDWLTGQVEPSARVRIKVLNLAWAELCRDLERAIEFDQSQFFRKIYEEEFGTPGGEPYGLLVIDQEVRHRPAADSPTDDVTALAALAGVAAAAFVPTIIGASPALLQLDDFTDVTPGADLIAPFRSPEYARWRGLAGREDMRFLGIVLPRLLARQPWADDPARIDGFRYAEYAPDAACRVWMSAGYAFAMVAARAFATHAWPADVRGSQTDREGGGLVTGLVVEPFTTDPDHVWVRPALDLVLSDRQEKALADAGLIPLSAMPYAEEAVFSAVRSLQSPASFTGPNAAAATASARLSAQVNSMLCVSRFAHCLKMLGRQMVGSFRTAEEIEQKLQAWLRSYVDANMNSAPETRARYPLMAGRVTVREHPSRPGVFGCTILLQPHFQLDDVSATFRLVTDISAPGVRG